MICPTLTVDKHLLLDPDVDLSNADSWQKVKIRPRCWCVQLLQLAKSYKMTGAFICPTLAIDKKLLDDCHVDVSNTGSLVMAYHIP